MGGMPCEHPVTETVILAGEDRPVAEVCTSCLARVAVGHNCSDCEHDDVWTLAGEMTRFVYRRCPVHQGAA